MEKEPKQPQSEVNIEERLQEIDDIKAKLAHALELKQQKETRMKELETQNPGLNRESVYREKGDKIPPIVLDEYMGLCRHEHGIPNELRVYSVNNDYDNATKRLYEEFNGEEIILSPEDGDRIKLLPDGRSLVSENIENYDTPYNNFKLLSIDETRKIIQDNLQEFDNKISELNEQRAKLEGLLDK